MIVALVIQATYGTITQATNMNTATPRYFMARFWLCTVPSASVAPALELAIWLKVH